MALHCHCSGMYMSIWTNQEEQFLKLKKQDFSYDLKDVTETITYIGKKMPKIATEWNDLPLKCAAKEM